MDRKEFEEYLINNHFVRYEFFGVTIWNGVEYTFYLDDNFSSIKHKFNELIAYRVRYDELSVDDNGRLYFTQKIYVDDMV